MTEWVIIVLYVEQLSYIGVAKLRLVVPLAQILPRYTDLQYEAHETADQWGHFNTDDKDWSLRLKHVRQAPDSWEIHNCWTASDDDFKEGLLSNGAKFTGWYVQVELDYR